MTSSTLAFMAKMRRAAIQLVGRETEENVSFDFSLSFVYNRHRSHTRGLRLNLASKGSQERKE